MKAVELNVDDEIAALGDAIVAEIADIKNKKVSRPKSPMQFRPLLHSLRIIKS
jgi:hypothetical protein